jgi:nucleoid-associated protein EbfC
MFKEMGQIMGLMKNLPKLQESMREMQEKVGLIVVDGNAGAGMVTCKVNGRMELKSLVISEDALKLNDKDVLADLVIAAVNMAMAKARDEVAQASSQMAQGMGLPIPPGMIPGL